MTTQTAEKTQAADAPKTTQAVATRPVRSVLIDMSEKYGMEPQAFEETVRATCMPPDRKTGRVPNRAEFAAFLLVAKAHDLNPLLREIFAFTSQSGGIVPIVSVDGWVNLINSHPQLDGIEFEETHNGEALISTKCKIHRKDRKLPIEVTEYLSECWRDTGPWKMKHRMLRHKALIQCSRYAFGFAGIYDEDEGRAIIEAMDREPVRTPPRPTVPVEVEDLGNQPDGKMARSSQVDDVGFGSEPEQPAKQIDHDPETGEVHENTSSEREQPAAKGESTGATAAPSTPAANTGPTTKPKEPGELLSALFKTLNKIAKGPDAKADVLSLWHELDIPASVQGRPNADETIGMAKGMVHAHARTLGVVFDDAELK